MKHIIDKDLNLLKIFVALWQHRNVTRAAASLKMTQPALSRALGRLREEFSDPLFVRVARGMSPTERAVELSELIEMTMRHLEDAFAAVPDFDPASMRRVVSIETSDYFEALAATELVPSLIKEAPQLAINFRTNAGRIPKEAMERGEVDLVVSGVFEDLPEGFYQQKLLNDHYISMVRKDHPCKKFNLKSFTSYPHILVTPKGDLSGVVDGALNRIKKDRHISLGYSQFLSAAWTLPHTDLILSAPSKLVSRLEDYLPLRSFAAPVKLPELKVYQLWHARSHQDPAMMWLRKRIHQLCLGL